MAGQVLPPPTYPYDPNDPQSRVAWENYWNSLANFSLTAAPVDAHYWVSSTNGSLTNDENLGTLTTGVMFVTVAAGIATPSSMAQVTVTRGGTGANLSATGGVSQVVRQSTAGGAFTVSRLASLDLSDVLPGTYTPTLTNVTNLAASTAYACQYLQVGTVVMVSGLVDVDPTAAGVAELGLSLPVVSNLTALEQCAGTAASAAVAGFSAAIVADAANNRASLRWVAVDTANRTLSFSFQYQVLP